MPDGQEIKVSFAAVEAAAGNIKSGYNKMTEELDNLKAKLAPLREIYQGQARDNWDRVQKDWDNAQTELNMVLASIGSAVAQAGETYRSTEQSVGNLWGQ